MKVGPGFSKGRSGDSVPPDKRGSVADTETECLLAPRERRQLKILDCWVQLRKSVRLL